nr:hypothetical protein BaRGS_020150 [Batillaria attramentaria]
MTQTELVLKVFLRLVEDVVAFQNVPAHRRREILQALTSTVPQLFQFFLQLLDAYRGSSASNKEGMLVCQSVLSTLTGFVDWVNISHITDDSGHMLRTLCEMLGDGNLQLHAAECLLLIVSRKGKVEDRKPILSLFSPVAMKAILDAAGAAARNLQDEHHYLFLKRLCQVLTEIGRQLCALWGQVGDISRPEEFDTYLKALLAFTQHPSQVGLPSQNNSPSCEYSRFDFDSDEDFLQFFATDHLPYSLSSPEYLEWEAMTVFTESVMLRLFQSEKTLPDVNLGVQLLSQLLTYQNQDPLIQSCVLSCMSALFPFLRHSPATLPAVLEMPEFEHLYVCIKNIDADPDQLSQMERCILIEALIIVSNQFFDFERQSTFIAEIMYCINMILACMKRTTWPADINVAERGGFVASKLEDGSMVLRNPATAHITQFLDNLLALIKTFCCLWLPEFMQLRHAEFTKAYDLQENERLAVLGIQPPCIDNTDSLVNKQPLERMQNFISVAYDNCFHILGNAGQCLGHEFYTWPNLAQVLVDSVFRNMEHLPDYRVKPIIRKQMMVNDEDGAESQEVLEDQLTRQLTREYLELIGMVCVSRLSKAEVTEEVAMDEGLQTHGQHDTNQANLISLALTVYEEMRPQYPELKELLQTVPDCTPEAVQNFEKNFLQSVSPQKMPSEKKKKDMFKKLVSSIIGKDIGQLFKREVHYKTLPPMFKRRPRQQMDILEEGDANLCSLFKADDI